MPILLSSSMTQPPYGKKKRKEEPKFPFCALRLREKKYGQICNRWAGSTREITCSKKKHFQVVVSALDSRTAFHTRYYLTAKTTTTTTPLATVQID